MRLNLRHQWKVASDSTLGRAWRGEYNGRHDGFPAYQAYVQDKLVYSHDPIATRQTPLSLFPPMEFDVMDNGIAFRDRNGEASRCECKGTYDDWSRSRDEWDR